MTPSFPTRRSSDLASFFEVTTAAAFLAFTRIPADDCIIEVGLGGRLDATNIIPPPAVCGIASLGIDHEAFLLAPEDGTPSEPAMRIARSEEPTPELQSLMRIPYAVFCLKKK